MDTIKYPRVNAIKSPAVGSVVWIGRDTFGSLREENLFLVEGQENWDINDCLDFFVTLSTSNEMSSHICFSVYFTSSNHWKIYTKPHDLVWHIQTFD
jgi:hypothetical protein